MIKIIFSLIICFVAKIGFSQIVLQEGTPIKVTMIKTVSSKSAQVGDIINFKLSSQLLIDSVLVIDTSSEVIGEIIIAQKARSLGRPGKLDFTINSIKAVDGQYISLRTTTKKTTGKEVTGGAVAAAVFINPIALLIPGDEVVIKKGKEFVVFVDRNYTIKCD